MSIDNHRISELINHIIDQINTYTDFKDTMLGELGEIVVNNISYDKYQ